MGHRSDCRLLHSYTNIIDSILLPSPNPRSPVRPAPHSHLFSPRTPTFSLLALPLSPSSYSCLLLLHTPTFSLLVLLPPTESHSHRFSPSTPTFSLLILLPPPASRSHLFSPRAPKFSLPILLSPRTAASCLLTHHGLSSSQFPRPSSSYCTPISFLFILPSHTLPAFLNPTRLPNVFQSQTTAHFHFSGVK